MPHMCLHHSIFQPCLDGCSLSPWFILCLQPLLKPFCRMTHIPSSFLPTSINPSFCQFGLRSWKVNDPHLLLLCPLSGSSVLRLLPRKVTRAATGVMLHTNQFSPYLIQRPVINEMMCLKYAHVSPIHQSDHVPVTHWSKAVSGRCFRIEQTSPTTTGIFPFSASVRDCIADVLFTFHKLRWTLRLTGDGAVTNEHHRM